MNYKRAIERIVSAYDSALATALEEHPNHLKFWDSGIFRVPIPFEAPYFEYLPAQGRPHSGPNDVLNLLRIYSDLNKFSRDLNIFLDIWSYQFYRSTFGALLNRKDVFIGSSVHKENLGKVRWANIQGETHDIAENTNHWYQKRILDAFEEQIYAIPHEKIVMCNHVRDLDDFIAIAFDKKHSGKTKAGREDITTFVTAASQAFHEGREAEIWSGDRDHLYLQRIYDNFRSSHPHLPPVHIRKPYKENGAAKRLKEIIKDSFRVYPSNRNDQQRRPQKYSKVPKSGLRDEQTHFFPAKRIKEIDLRDEQADFILSVQE